jgi:hypothetical protein
MAIDVEISVLGGKVVITVGAQSSTTQTDPGPIAAQGNVGNPAGKKPVGGDSPIDPPLPSGTGGPGSGSGCTVIGPIVVDASMLQAPATPLPPGPPAAVKKRGGDSPIDPPLPSGTGGPGAGTGCLVIGPIVIGNCKSGVAVTPPLTTVEKFPPPVK